MGNLGVKERVIKTASRLFYENGYSQTGINQIIAEANVAKTSMYHHFKSKEDIAVVYLQRKHRLWMRQLENCAIEKNKSQEILLTVFEYIEFWSNSVDHRGCSWQNIVTELPMNHHKIKNEVAYSKNEVKKWIQNVLKEDGRYSDYKKLGDQILVLMEGAYMLSQIHKKAWPVIAAKDACMKLLV